MSLRQTIQHDLQESIKQKAEARLSALRLLWDSIIKKEKDKRANLKDVDEEKKEKESRLPDEEIQLLVASSIKKNKEAIEQFRQGGREDLADKNQKEISVLEKYLPEQLGEEEIRALVEKAIQETKAKAPADFGKVMGRLMPQLKGRADGAMVGEIVKEKLS